MLSELAPTKSYDEGHINVLGARVHYLHSGSGRPMLLLHGLVGSSSNWRYNIDALAREASVYALDMVNMGKSDRIDGLDAGLEATAGRIAAFMDALGIAQADIAGHSHGGAVALMLAARHPVRVRSLILFAPANPFSDLGDLLVRIYSTAPGRWIARTAPHLPTRLQRFGLERMYGDPARVASGCLEGYIDGMRVPGTMRHILAIVGCWFADMERLREALPRVASTPALLIWGDRDRAVDPASAMQLQRILWQSELRVLRGGGHIPFEEMPEQSNRIMLDWLSRDLASGPLASGVQLNPARYLLRRKRPASVAAPAKTSAAM